MESGLLGAAALELVVLPSHSTAAAAANEVDVSSLRVSAVLDIVFSKGGGEEGGGIAGGSAPESSNSAGARMAREAVAAAIRKTCIGRLFSKNGRMPRGAGRRTSTSFEAINASSATGIPNLVR